MSAAERATEMAKAGAAGHVSGLSLGDVVTVEPPLGVVLSDEDNGLWKHLPRGWAHYRADGRMHTRLSGISWDTVYCSRPLRVVELPGDTEQLISELDDARVTIRALVEPKPAPAEEWEAVTAKHLRAGDDVEITHKDDGYRATFAGTVVALGPGDVTLSGGHRITIHPGDLIPTVMIRRRIHTPMPEPDAPAVVKHAGRIVARTEHYRSYPWIVLAGPKLHGETVRVGTWREVLAMDPTTDPVLVDLGGES